jgi:hypothetical protein
MVAIQVGKVLVGNRPVDDAADEAVDILPVARGSLPLSQAARRSGSAFVCSDRSATSHGRWQLLRLPSTRVLGVQAMA